MFQKGQKPPKKGEKMGPRPQPSGPEPLPELTKPDPKTRLTGSPPSYEEMANRTRMRGAVRADFSADPAVQKAMAQDRELQSEIEASYESAEVDAEASLELLVESSAPEDGHEFANGVSIPFPYQGAPTTNHATCSRPMRDENRGCPVYWHCPLRDTGPWLLAYMDLRHKKQIRQITCVDFLKTGMVFQPDLVLLPGITWEGTITAEYTAFPDGTYPQPGPGKEKTPIKLTARKSELPPHLFPKPEDLVDYQRLRRHGKIKPFRM